MSRQALVVRSGALGDVLLLRRAVARLHAGGYDVHLVAPSAAGPALVGTGGSEVSGWSPSDAPGSAGLWAADGGCPAAIRDRLAGPESLAVVFTGSAEVAANLAALGVRVLARAPSPPPGQHAADWLSGALDDADLPPPVQPEPILRIGSEESAAARPWLDRLPERFVAVHAGSGSPRKNWPVARFAEVARGLAGGAPFLWIDGPADTPTEPSALDIPTWVRARSLPLRTLAAALARASVYVGNDSGVTHLAAATGAPTIAVFGPTEPAQWAPLGPAVQVVRADSGRLEDVEAPAVLAAADRLRAR
ncbi:MAG: glycosyltransferase family 9 protein [Vicinamibacteria bacterium]